MADVPAATPAPAEPVVTASPTTTPAPDSGVKQESPKVVPYDEYERVKGAAFKANRLYEEVLAKVEKLSQPPQKTESKPPAGVEERLNSLAQQLDEERRARAEEKLQIRVMEAASRHGVAADRVDYLDYKLRKANPKLTADGVPDETNPGAKISVDTLVSSLLGTPEGQVFKAAPATTSLPASSGTKTQPSGKPRFTKEQFERGLIPVALRKTGNYEVDS